MLVLLFNNDHLLPVSVTPHFLCAGAPEASASSVFISAATRCSGSPQQRASAEERPVRQTATQKQAQDQEDAETHHQPGRLSEYA